MEGEGALPEEGEINHRLGGGGAISPPCTWGVVALTPGFQKGVHTGRQDCDVDNAGC